MNTPNVPNVLFRPNSCQQLPDGNYKTKVAFKAIATLPVIRDLGTFAGGYAQMQGLSKRLEEVEQDSKERYIIMGEMVKTVSIIALSLFSLRMGAVVSTMPTAFIHMQQLLTDLQENKDWQTVGKDALKLGNQTVYILAMISGNPFFIALSLAAQSYEDISEGIGKLTEQYHAENRDNVEIACAVLQIGLGVLKGDKSLSIATKPFMTQPQQPQKSALLSDVNDLDEWKEHVHPDIFKEESVVTNIDEWKEYVHPDIFKEESVVTNIDEWKEHIHPDIFKEEPATFSNLWHDHIFS